VLIEKKRRGGGGKIGGVKKGSIAAQGGGRKYRTSKGGQAGAAGKKARRKQLNRAHMEKGLPVGGDGGKKKTSEETFDRGGKRMLRLGGEAKGVPPRGSGHSKLDDRGANRKPGNKRGTVPKGRHAETGESPPRIKTPQYWGKRMGESRRRKQGGVPVFGGCREGGF